MKAFTGIPPMNLPRWLYWMPKLFIGISFGAIVLAASYAYGAGTSIPARHAALCSQLGSPNESCIIKNSPRSSTVLLIIGVNDSVGSLTQNPLSANYVSTLTLKLPHNRYLQMSYQNTAWPEIPPCIFHSCIEGGYNGPIEVDLINALPLILSKLEYQYADGALADHLQTVLNSPGIPYIAKIISTKVSINDQTETILTTTLAVKVRIKFAVGAE